MKQYRITYLKNCFIYIVNKIRFFGFKNFCPVCNSYLKSFRPFRGRDFARCPVCKSLERHRLLWIFFQKNTNLFDGKSKRLLHIAPPPYLAMKLNGLEGIDYVSGDLNSKHVTMKIDITNIQFQDNHFDIIICNHVLEHIKNDITAISELHRVLKPGGWAVLQVPIAGEQTFEHLETASEEERERLYGHHDHVRSYGRDFLNRLESLKFSVDVIPYCDEVSPEYILRLGLDCEDIYFCKKQKKLSTECP